MQPLLSLVLAAVLLVGAAAAPEEYNILQDLSNTCQANLAASQAVETACGSGRYQSTLNLNLLNTGHASLPVPWTVTLQNPQFLNASAPFNLDPTLQLSDGAVTGSATNTWQTLLAGGANSMTFGLTVESASNDTQPYYVLLNGVQCQVTTSSPGQLPVVQPQHTTTRDGQIIGVDGVPIDLKGVAWFGFDDGSTMVDGLWVQDDPASPVTGLTQDFETVARRIELLGFNAIRIPFSFTDLYTLGPLNYTKPCIHAAPGQVLESVTPPELLDAVQMLDLYGINDTLLNDTLLEQNITRDLFLNPEFLSLLNGTIDSADEAVPFDTPLLCNDYVPKDSTLNRFLWVLSYFANRGFYVVLVHQTNNDGIAASSPAQWLQSWRWLMQGINQDPVLRLRIVIDPLNEPDSYTIRWEANATLHLPGASDLYLSVMDALYAINPATLFMIQGCGQAQARLVNNWGDGFVTDPVVLAATPGASDPNPFFRSLMGRPYLDQVVIAPHVYPPSITNNPNLPASGPELYMQLSRSFGYLNTVGYCFEGHCHRFPIIVGETGSLFETQADVNSMYDIMDYMHNVGAASDGRHNRIGSWMWWAWNADSGDTGGLVENDWESIIWPKIDYLTQLGLEPWYLALQDALEPAILQGLNGTLVDDVSADPPRPAFYIPETPAPPACSDNPPDNVYTCTQQQQFGKCSVDWMVAGNYCASTCGRCTGSSGARLAVLPEAAPPRQASPSRAQAPAPAGAEGKAAPAGGPAALPATAPTQSDAHLPDKVRGSPTTTADIGTFGRRLQTASDMWATHSQTLSIAETLTVAGQPVAVSPAESGPMALQAPYQIVLHNPSWGGVPNSWNVHVEEASTGLILGSIRKLAMSLVGDGGSGSLNWVVQSSVRDSWSPTMVELNGEACTLTVR
eukprot:jgi/Astpho2/9180/fgenesh1_pg.00137_%23_8_t